MDDKDYFTDDIYYKEIFDNDKFLFKSFEYMNNFIFYETDCKEYFNDFIKKNNSVNIFSIISKLKDDDAKAIEEYGPHCIIIPQNFTVKSENDIENKINKIISQNLKNATFVGYTSDFEDKEIYKFIEKYGNKIIKYFTKVIIFDSKYAECSINYNIKNLNKNLIKLCYLLPNNYKNFNNLPNKLIDFTTTHYNLTNFIFLPSSLKILNYFPNSGKIKNIKTINKFPNSLRILQYSFDNDDNNIKIKLELPYKLKCLHCENINILSNKTKSLKILKYCGNIIPDKHNIKSVDILDIYVVNKESKKYYFDVNIECNTLFFSVSSFFWYNQLNISNISNIKNIIFKNESNSIIDINMPQKINILSVTGQKDTITNIEKKNHNNKDNNKDNNEDDSEDDNKNNEDENNKINYVFKISSLPKKINFLRIKNTKLFDIKCHDDDTVVNILSYDNVLSVDDRIFGCSKNFVLNNKEIFDFYDKEQDKHYYVNKNSMTDNYLNSIIKDLIHQKIK